MLFPKAVLLAILATTLGVRIPTRDYDQNHYFVIDMDTSHSQEPLQSFINLHKGDFKFEHQVTGLDDHYVFSIRKDNPVADIMGDFNVGVSSSSSRLMRKRDGFEVKYDSVLSARGLRSIQWMEPKKLKKRLPVFIQRDAVAAADAAADAPGIGLGGLGTLAGLAGSTPDTTKPQLGQPGFTPADSSQKPLQDTMEKLQIQDPIFQEQWHLINTNYPGNDVNVTGLWYEGITGEGVCAAVIDDGLDYESEDLKANFNSVGSWDFNTNQNLPLPRLYDDWHGTRCAGEIGAAKNDVCGVGVAYDGKIAGIRILSGPITADQEASAMMYGLDTNDIFLCLWGPTDDGKTLAAPDLIVKKAMVKSVQKGRKEKGSIYVFASGNGGRSKDSCNFDGYTNSIYSITVGAIDHKGLHPLYSEACSAVMVVTYSSGSGEHIHTTDIKKKCSLAHGGTLAAAPLAAGVFSLVLQMNPELTWRDLQYACALLSVPVNENDGNYQTTALGRKYSHKYGYGKIDAYALGHFAKTWTNVKPQSWYYSDVITVGEKINGAEDDNKIITSNLTITKEDLAIVNLERVEHITVTVNIASTYRGKVGMRITSPFGVVSDLASFRPLDSSKDGFVDWTFMSVAHWGESGIGDWKLEVFSNKPNNDHILEFKNYQLRLFGESINADDATIYDISKDYAAERRDKQNNKEGDIGVDPAHTESEAAATTTASTSTTSSEVSSSSTTPVESTTGSPVEDDTEISSLPSDDSEVADEDGKTKQYTSDHTGQYFMALAVVGFIVVILFMKYHKSPSSKRRRRREEYEFDIIPGEDYTDSEDDGNDDDSLDLGRYNNQQRGDQQNRRTSEEERDRLYDEFNADTLPVYEEDDMFKIGDEEEDKDIKNKKDLESSLEAGRSNSSAEAEEGKDKSDK